MGIFNALRRRLNKRRVAKQGANPSILDYVGNRNRLVIDMNGMKPGVSRPSTASHDSESLTRTSVSEDTTFHSDPIEWSLPLVDKKAAEPLAMADEIKRLQTLADYFVLDQKGEEEFDRIQDLASMFFDAPMAMVTFVDLGRMWVMPRVGAEDWELPRKYAPCAHVVISKTNDLVLKDAAQDDRFKESPVVVGGQVRFYAGAALVTPEGYKIGTICIASPNARPEGLTTSQLEMLHKMADMVVSGLVARRNRLIREETEQKFKDLEKTLVDASRSLVSSKKTIDNLLTGEASSAWGMDSAAAADLSSVSRDIGMVVNVCSVSSRNILGGAEASTASVQEEEKDDFGIASANMSSYDSIMNGYDQITNPTTDIKKMFNNLNIVIPSFPYHGQVSLEVDKRIPREIMAEDLLLFRATLNMLTHCMNQSGPNVAPELNKSGLRIRRMKNGDNEMLIQCLQAGPPVESADAKAIYKDTDSLLGPVTMMVRSLGGRYGMYHSKWDPSSPDSCLQSIFWFQIPYEPASPEDSELGETLKKVHYASEKTSVGVGGGATGIKKRDCFMCK